MNISGFTLAQRFIGLAEVPGALSHPMILAMLRLDQQWPAGDDVPWCGAFCNYIAWLLRLPRSKDLRARSWLGVGAAVDLVDAEVGFDVVILARGAPPHAPATDMDAPGHVGFFAGRDGAHVLVLGGNQGDKVSTAPFAASTVLGVRRLRTDA